MTMEEEAVFLEMMSEAQATRRCGGIVIVQVKRMARRGTLPAKQVKIPAFWSIWSSSSRTNGRPTTVITIRLTRAN